MKKMLLASFMLVGFAVAASAQTSAGKTPPRASKNRAVAQQEMIARKNAVLKQQQNGGTSFLISTPDQAATTKAQKPKN